MFAKFVKIKLTPLLFGRRNLFNVYEMSLAVYDGSDHDDVVHALLLHYSKQWFV